MTALYQKYRPTRFEDVVGQDHIVRVLQHAVQQKKPAHAYVFAGGRGTGKTSLARIFAEQIGAYPADIIEIDAASHTGVDDIREIIEGVHVLPFGGQYKIYILDEAHMLSRSAFNALLKTLEEPPRHAIFILATTDPDKLPETVLSRCNVLSFDKPRNASIEHILERALTGEKIEYDIDAVSLLALLADGSFRDSLSLLQSVISAYPREKITRAYVEDVTGAPKSTMIREILEAVEHTDAARICAVIRELENGGVRALLFVEVLILTTRTVLHMRFGGEHARADLKKESEHIQQLIIALAKAKTVNASFLDRLLTAHRDMKRSALPFAVLEVALLMTIE